MVKFFPNRYYLGQQDFWQTHLVLQYSCYSELGVGGRTDVPPSSFGATPNRCAQVHRSFRYDLQSCESPSTHFHLQWICTFLYPEGRENIVPHWITCCTVFINVHEQATVLPVPVWSGCSPTPLHSCRIGFFFHHVLELIPYVKRAKGYVNELFNGLTCDIQADRVLVGLTHQPQLWDTRRHSHNPHNPLDTWVLLWGSPHNPAPNLPPHSHVQSFNVLV